MINSIKVILISQSPLPAASIGSWTTLYKNYFEGDHQIDYIVCEKPENEFENVKYEYVSHNILLKIISKLQKQPHLGSLKALDKILKTDQRYVIQVVDNFKIVPGIKKILMQKGIREKCVIQFFYHGFPPFLDNVKGNYFFQAADEMVLLTHDSYKAHRDYYTVLPIRFSVLHNGIDTHKFFPLALKEKIRRRSEKVLGDKKIFVWCSQDRPKKGLHIILDVWKRFHRQFPDTELWVIGCNPKQKLDGVFYIGRIPNDELPYYFQLSDCFLFPTLCHEGFGLSLIEALHCGNYCIASRLGGVPEVLQYGKYGKLIEKPHFVSAWEEAMVEFMKSPKEFTSVPEKLYSTATWNEGMNKIITNAKNFLK
jgi:glycosyltransferase involved in cell wall biosynthesis